MLLARSLDEIVTRDIVLGRLVGEDVPRLLFAPSREISW
jgi:hypothetical protein